MYPASTSAKLTYDDFLLFPDDDRLRHEIIDGVHYVTAAPATKHQRVSIRLSYFFEDYFRTHGIGEAFAAPFDVLLSRHDIVEPDLVVVLNNQAEIVTPQHARGAPAMVIEITSPGTRRRDEGIKLRLYERTGVLEYWLIDVAADTLLIWSRSPAGAFVQRPPVRARDNAVATTPLLPDFTLPLADLFR